MSTPQTLFLRSFGDGPEDILALHCTIAHSGAWRGVATALDGQARISAPDMLFHGKSPDWDGEGDFLARMIDAILPHLDRPMHLMGHSFGAALALGLACAVPERVKSLTMVESVFFAMGYLEDADVVEASNAAGSETTEALARGDWETGARLFNRAWSGAGPRWPDMPQQMRDAMIRGVRIVPVSWPGIGEDSQRLIPQLEKLTMPTLLVRGSTSPPVVEVVNRGFLNRLPRSQEIIVEGAGHMLPVTHPAPLAEAVSKMLA